MADFNYQGDANLLSDKQINFISDILKKHDFDGSKVIIETLGKAGDNYSSSMKTIIAERGDGNIMKMVAKVAPTSEFMRSSLSVETVFGNEFAMYNNVLPKFQELEIEAGVEEQNRLRFPICYGILEETLHEIILLEDLKESDFVMLDRFKSLTDKEVRTVLDAFAKLHSLSFVLRQKDPRAYAEYTSKLNDFFTSQQMDFNVKNSFTLMEEHVISLFDNNRYIHKIRGAISNIADEAHKLKRFDIGSKYSVIIHGDSWTNNIMFKLNDTDGVPEKCALIDYQLSAEKSPVSDLLYLIFSCTDYDTRSKHYNEWIDEYHEKLDNYLGHHGIKATYVYSKEKLLTDLKRYAKFFLAWSIVISNVLFMDTADAAKLQNAMDTTTNVDEIMETMTAESVNSEAQVLMKARIQGVIDSFYEFGYCT